MKIDRKAALKKLKALIFNSKTEVEDYRKNLEDTYSTVFLPNRVECTEKEFGGVPCDVISPMVCSSCRVMIYIHGGSFVGGSRKASRGFCAQLAHASSCRIIVPEFRLPPTYPFPASIEDLVAVFRSVYEAENILRGREISEGSRDDDDTKGRIIIAADTSGASLACALIFKINKKYRCNIQHLILFSPWLDLSSDNPLIAKKRVSDEVLSGEALHAAVDKYTYAANISNPLVSPLKAPPEDFEDFPPVYIQMGEKEILVQQAKELKSKLTEVNVECELDVWPNMMYMFQLADEFLPDSHLAVEKVGRFLSSRKPESVLDRMEREKIIRKNHIGSED